MYNRKIFFAVLFYILCTLPAKGTEILSQIDFVDATPADIINSLARQAGLDIVMGGDNALAEGKKTSLHLSNMGPEEAIYYVLQANGLSYQKKGQVLLISSDQSEKSEGNGEQTTQTLNLKYLSAEKATELLTKILPALKTSVGESARVLVLHGRESAIIEARKLIDEIDRPLPQILIESKVLEVSDSDALRLGVTYGTQPGVFKFITNKDTKKTSPAEDLLTTINFLISTGKANVVATPRIATLDNHEAVINIGSRVPYAVPVTSGSNSTQWTVDYIDAGVKLKITPWLGEKGDITTLIQPEVSCISEWRGTFAGEFPVISTRNAQATVRVKDGETIVVGGLLSETERENILRLPVLGYLPLIGLLFQNKTVEKAKNEIVFLITPHVI